MQESVIYQDIVQKQALKMIIRLLKPLFGDVNDSLMTHVRELSADDLEDLGEALFNFSEISDLVAWLKQKKSVTQQFKNF
jgi:hypothetical protein